MKSYKQFVKSILESKITLTNPPHTNRDVLNSYPYKMDDIHKDTDVKKNGKIDENVIQSYTEGSYRENNSKEINDYLRELHYGSIKRDESKHHHVRSLESQFTPENTNRVDLHHFYSGIPNNIGEDIANSPHGSVHYNPGFHSFSSHPGVAREFAEGYRNYPSNPVIHLIHAKKIHKGVGMSVVPESSSPNENELVIRPGNHAIYHGTDIIDHHDGIGKIHIHHMEYINHQEDHENYGIKTS